MAGRMGQVGMTTFDWLVAAASVLLAVIAIALIVVIWIPPITGQPVIPMA
jgi:hypothetical protein